MYRLLFHWSTRWRSGLSNPSKLAAIATRHLLLATVLMGGCLLGQPALAEVRQIQSTLVPKKSETFPDLMKRAEATASALVEQAFRNNPKLNQLTLTVSADRNGQEAPLLLVSVSRSGWRKTPKLRPWATYFNNFSIALLGYRKPPVPDPVISAVPQPASPVAIDPTTGAPTATPNPANSLPNNAPTIPTPAAPSANLPPILPTNPGVIPSRARSQNDPAYRDD